MSVRGDSPCLLVAISAHGYGHAAQCAVVAQALHRLRPDIEFVVQSTLPELFLRGRLAVPFRYLAHADDFGMCMTSTLAVDVEASLHAYRQMHRDWEHRVAAGASRLRRLAPDLVLADVPYLTLAAAAREGIPAVALCSLHWGDIFAHYCGTASEAEIIRPQINDAYASADCFLRPAPSMPMPTLHNTRAIGALAALGHAQPECLRTACGAGADDRLVLAAPGGIDTPVDLNRWPRSPGVHWLVPRSWNPQRSDCTDFESVGMSFTDMLASVDALLGKPGYGTVAECACNGIPMLYVERGDWPEEPYLLEWLHAHARAAKIAREQFYAGDFIEELRALWDTPVPERPAPTGAREAAEVIAGYL